MSSRNQPTKKPYCKVCHDAGKPESVYTSHYVKTSLDANAKIACPTLLALECKYCFQSGHTVKYCSVIKKNEKAKRTEEFKKIQQEQKKTKPVASSVKNAFSSLCDLSDDDEEEVQAQQLVQVLEKEEFPQLNAVKMEQKMQQVTSTLSFASVAYLGQAKEKEEMQRKYEKEQQYEKEQLSQKPTYQVIVPEPFLASKMNWADYDTESDNESDF